ncbi:CYFA0S33e00452g1_1 [Cyberlindnera fabianii]|uniref:Kinetochore protein Spc24 n=1 Tax=Cyberlindnera fabianii TaxID=36022 RepID=A0A061BI75_CYBFA|nr:putative kinetochore protein spc24 [Cyberlindnera fabianii]CDR47561.1 CYFA0S33e00452g1_1 [Cyberlindnera fabianii]
MVLQIDPAELLRETLEGCDIETDIDTIDRIAENLRVLQTERENKIVTGQQELQTLSGKLAQQKQVVQEMEASKVRNEIKSRIKESQNAELDINKALKELTSARQELSTNMSNLVDEFNSLEKQIEDLDYIEEPEDKDAVVLKLMVYRKLGLKVDLKSSVLIIYNKEKNLTDFLNYGDDKYSDYFISNYIWDRF